MNPSARLPLVKRYLRRLLRLRAALGGMLFCMVLAAFLEPLLALMLKPLLDGGDFIIARAHIPFFAAVVMTALPLAAYGRAYLGGWLDITMQRDLRRGMAAKFVCMPLAALAEETSGKTTTRFMSYVPSLTSPTLSVFVALVQEPLKTMFYLAQMFYLEWQLALIVCGALPATAFLVGSLGRRMKKSAGRAQEETAHAQSRLNESIALMPIIKIHGEAAAGSKINAVFSRLRAAALRVQIIIAAGQPLAMLALAVPSVLVLFYVVRALESGTMTQGDVAVFIGCMLLLPRSVRAVTRSVILLEGMLVAAREVFGFLDAPTETDEGRQTVTRARGEIVFDDVHLQYPNSTRPALAGVSVKIAAGETVALVGRSGAGKTTLANLLPRFYSPQRGAVCLDGGDIRRLTLASLRAQIAVVTQTPLLFDDTVAFNVAYPDGDAADSEKINRALKDAAADGFVAALPQGAQTPVGENGGRLSGGQQQRIALARAFYRNAPVVILDEATSSLDAKTEVKIRAAMRRLLAGRTAIIIAHRFSTIDFADRVLVLDEGRLVAAGRSDELLQTCPLYAELYRTQQLP